jgi:3-oxoacyl-[acyl-carrier protein] reductase
MFKEYESIQVGDSASLIKKITIEDIKKFVEMTGDNNPLHVNREYAETTPFKDVVVHGMLGASFISTVIGTQLPGDGALWISQAMEFLLPVRLNDVLNISCTVIKKHDRENLLELETKITNQLKQVVLSGSGKVKVFKQAAPEKVEDRSARLKVAIVTGGAGGIGRAICLKLAEQGYSVVVNYATNEEKAHNLAEQIVLKGGKAIAVKADIGNAQEVEKLVQMAKQTFGGIGLLVNNASSRINPKSFQELDWEEMDQHLRVQLKGAFQLTKACLPEMKRQGYGKIVSLTTQAIDNVPTAAWTSYAVAKSALATFSKCLAVELGPLGITVNCVSPGMTDTALIGDISEKSRLIVARQAPLRRIASPQDIAEAVSFLASAGADYITGETIRVNGGQVML